MRCKIAHKEHKTAGTQTIGTTKQSIIANLSALATKVGDDVYWDLCL